ncbi:SH3 domain-containing protein C23A1.17-like [Polypterus senegalus]|uniref:SH3 domain-containing protein C23A1.17-like n=1 Tax=Polypterus senegalus TaxID=55291 RepID=UPI001964FAB0|nr:SH3 domain-containing protein C23A1.17-like [Polypterus senegalus]
MTRHISIFKSTDEPKVVFGAQQYSCPFCCKRTDYAGIISHLQSHKRTAVIHGGFKIYKCSLNCQGSSHYHCCYCQKTVVRKDQFLWHLSQCGKAPAVFAVPASIGVQPLVASTPMQTSITVQPLPLVLVPASTQLLPASAPVPVSAASQPVSAASQPVSAAPQPVSPVPASATEHPLPSVPASATTKPLPSVSASAIAKPLPSVPALATAKPLPSVPMSATAQPLPSVLVSSSLPLVSLSACTQSSSAAEGSEGHTRPHKVLPVPSCLLLRTSVTHWQDYYILNHPPQLLFSLLPSGKQ